MGIAINGNTITDDKNVAIQGNEVSGIAMNGSIVYRAKPKIIYDPIFGNNSWEIIGQAIARDEVPDTWRVGNEKNITLSTNEVLTLQIYGIDHDDLTAGGKAKFTLGMKNLMAATRAMNSTNTNVGGFSQSAMYSWLRSTLYTSIPSDLRAIIKPVDKKTSAGNQITTISTQSMNVFLFSEIECFGTTTNSVSGEGYKYEIFTTNISRVKYLSNGAGTVSAWWNRSPNKSNSTSFTAVTIAGIAATNTASNTYGVCVGFCI